MSASVRVAITVVATRRAGARRSPPALVRARNRVRAVFMAASPARVDDLLARRRVSTNVRPRCAAR